MRSTLSPLAKEKGHPVREMVVSCAVEHIFIETAMHAKATASNHLAKANRASSGPRVRAKERVRRNPKENPRVPTVPKVRTMVKPRKLVHPVSKNRNRRQVQKTQESAQTYPTDTSLHVSFLV